MVRGVFSCMNGFVVVFMVVVILFVWLKVFVAVIVMLYVLFLDSVKESPMFFVVFSICMVVFVGVGEIIFGVG